MAKVKFTAGRVADFQCESGKSQSFMWDSTAPGLGLRATASGAKSYIFQSKLNGTAIRVTIGAPSVWNIAAAQSEARRLKLIIDNGQDPRQVKADGLAAEQANRDAKEVENATRMQEEIAERTRRELLARDAWDVYLAYPRPATGKRKWGSQHRADHVIAANPGGELCKIGGKIAKSGPLASLLNMPLYAITPQVIHDWLALECLTRPTFAHNCFRKFRTFINWCAKRPEFQDAVHADCCLTDEVKNITPTSKTKEGDCLQREQLSTWFAAIRKIGNPVISAYLQGLLITGARRGELQLLKWAEVDFQWGSMTIRDKVHGQRTIPLTPYLSHLFAALPRRSEWVFSSPTAESGHITEPRIAHTGALDIAGLPHVSLHGLRRSFGTLSEWVEVPAGIAAQIQGHAPQGVREKNYIRRPLDLLRMWHIKIEAWMLEQAGIALTPLEQGLKIVKSA